jgi:hypothetical protein
MSLTRHGYDRIGGNTMRIAARMAVEAAAPDRRRKERFVIDPALPVIVPGYHGGDIVIVDLSESGFRASVATHIPPKSLVRLKVPGLGMVLARIVWSRKGDVGGEFVNPVGEGRLRLVPGFGSRVIPQDA